MQKIKIIVGLLIAVAIITALVLAYKTYNQRVQAQGNAVAKNETKTTENTTKKEETEETKEEIKTNNIAVVYFSATGTTKKVAEYASEKLDAKLIEIVPKQAYTKEDLEYNNDESRATKEQNDDKARPELKDNLDLDEYDTILLGYPIWWGKTPKIILTLIDNGALDGKTVIPFCTSGSSGIEGSVQSLKNYTSKVEFLEKNAKRFGSDVSKEDVSSWIDTLNIEKGE